MLSWCPAMPRADGETIQRARSGGAWLASQHGGRKSVSSANHPEELVAHGAVGPLALVGLAAGCLRRHREAALEINAAWCDRVLCRPWSGAWTQNGGAHDVTCLIGARAAAF